MGCAQEEGEIPRVDGTTKAKTSTAQKESYEEEYITFQNHTLERDHPTKRPSPPNNCKGISQNQHALQTMTTESTCLMTMTTKSTYG